MTSDKGADESEFAPSVEWTEESTGADATTTGAALLGDVKELWLATRRNRQPNSNTQQYSPHQGPLQTVGLRTRVPPLGMPPFDGTHQQTIIMTLDEDLVVK